MDETIKVKPVKGQTVPLESNPQRTVSEEMAVPDTRYYRRMIAKGALEVVTSAAAAEKKGGR